MVQILKRASGVITGTGAGHWDTMVDFLGAGQGGTGIRFNDEGTATIRFLRTDTGNMNMWMSDGQREYSIVGYNTGGGGVLGPNLRLIGDTLTSVPAIAFYQTNAVLGDTTLGSMLGDDQNVNIYAFPATYNLAFLTYDTSPDGVGAKLWIGPGDTATIQWWSNAWWRIYSDEGVTETLAVDGQTGTVYLHGSILDADVATNSVGGTANEFANMYITTDGRYFMAADQGEWMKSTASDIRWGVNFVDELVLSTTLLAPVTAEGLDLGGVDNEFLNGYIGDTGAFYFGSDQDALISWNNAVSLFTIQTDDGAAGNAIRMTFDIGNVQGSGEITIWEPTIMKNGIDLENEEITRVLTATTLGAAATTFAAVGEMMVMTGDVGANTVATITGGKTGQTLTMLFVDALITITDNDAHAANSVDLAGTATDFVSADDSVLMLMYNGVSWYEVSRSVN